MRKLSLLFLSLFFLVSCSSTPPPQAQASKASVVIVHGFLSQGYWLKKLENEIAQNGHPTLAPRLRPHNGSVGIEVLAAQLKTRIDERFGPRQPIHLIGHSMGGLISRYYIQELGGARRIVSLQTIATPHLGAPLSYLHPGPGGRQMRPGSRFLTQLNDSPPQRFPETSYYTKADLVVPWRSSIRPAATNLEIPTALHHALPHHPEVIRQAMERITQAETSRF